MQNLNLHMMSHDFYKFVCSQHLSVPKFHVQARPKQAATDFNFENSSLLTTGYRTIYIDLESILYLSSIDEANYQFIQE